MKAKKKGLIQADLNDFINSPDDKALKLLNGEKSGSKSSKIGRSRKGQIDWEMFDEYCYMQCTLLEIAERFNVSTDTLKRRVLEKHGCTFDEYAKAKRCGGLVSLRRAQWKKALEGNVPLLIWLGKQYLGQTDRPTDENDKQPIVISADLLTALDRKRDKKN